MIGAEHAALVTGGSLIGWALLMIVLGWVLFMRE
jgi:hypothetical protein